MSKNSVSKGKETNESAAMFVTPEFIYAANEHDAAKFASPKPVAVPLLVNVTPLGTVNVSQLSPRVMDVPPETGVILFTSSVLIRL